MFESKKSRFGSFYSVKTTYFAFFLLFLKRIILKWKFQNASDFDLRGLQRVRFEIEKKYIFKAVLNASSFHFKKTQHVRVSVKNYTTFDRRIDFWQLPVVNLATKSTTDQTLSFNFFTTNKLVLTVTENIFIQSELEKQDKNQISEKRILKIVRFWI